MVRFSKFTSKKKILAEFEGFSPKVSSILKKTLYNIIVLNHDMACWKYENIHNTCYVYSYFFLVNMMIFFKINQVQIFYVHYVYT